MEMTGEQSLATSQQAVWEALNDLDILKACIPGCEAIDQVSSAEHHIVLTAAVGPVKARFKGKMFLEDPNPPQSYRIRFEGQGGVAGFAKGAADVSLQPDGAATLMRYTVRAQVGGKLAQVGSRLIDGAARKLADEFFAEFKARAVPAAATPAAPAAPVKSRGLPGWAWIAAAAATAALLYFLMR
jgi:carbon monoxide dehydrogenase subunit G